MCGIVEPECAYSALGYGDSLRDDKPGPETSKWFLKTHSSAQVYKFKYQFRQGIGSRLLFARV